MVGLRLRVLVLIAAVCCGCSTQSPQERLARKAADADRVVLVHQSGRHLATVSIQGDEVRQLVRAISAATPSGQELGEDNAFANLEFLKGTNRLAVLQCGPGRYWIDGKGYLGQTGDLMDPRGGGPIHFRLSNGFRGFIYFIRSKNGTEIPMEEGAYRLIVPAHGIVTVSNAGLLYSWPETASFMDGTEVPIQDGPAAGAVVRGDGVALRALGTFSANGLTFAAFHVGTQDEYEMDRFAGVGRLLPGVTFPPNPRPASTTILGRTAVAILLVCLCLSALRRDYVQLVKCRQNRKGAAAGAHDISLGSPLDRGAQDPAPRYSRLPPPFYHQGLLAAARQKVMRLPFLRSVRAKTVVDPAPVDVDHARTQRL